RWQGASHWEAVDARYEIEGWERLARLSAADQKEAARALHLEVVGSNLDAKGRHGEAETVFRESLAVRRRLLGEEHPNTALGYFFVAQNLDRQGRPAEAQPLLQKTLELRRKLLGEEHPHTAQSYNNLASNLNDQGKHAEAQALHQKAHDL